MISILFSSSSFSENFRVGISPRFPSSFHRAVVDNLELVNQLRDLFPSSFHRAEDFELRKFLRTVGVDFHPLFIEQKSSLRNMRLRKRRSFPSSFHRAVPAFHHLRPASRNFHPLFIEQVNNASGLSST